MCSIDGSDPFTMALQLCDDDGIVRGGAMHHGTDYACTSHAHFAGEHIRCTSPAHAVKGQPLNGWQVATTVALVTASTVSGSIPAGTAALRGVRAASGHDLEALA